MSEHDGGGLGVLTPDTSRTILVIGENGDLAVALREKVDRAYAIVKDVRPEEALAGFTTCIPWPWMIVGHVETLPQDVAGAVTGRPVLVFWRGAAPAGLPIHTRVFDRFTELAGAVNDAITRRVGGMRLAIGLGVDLPDGSFARSAELQALVASHPHPLDVPLDAFRSAARVLTTHRIDCKPVRDPATGAVSLVEGGSGAPR